MTSLAQLGVLESAGEEQGQDRVIIGLDQDGLGVSQLCVEANSQSVADPRKSTGDTAEKKAQTKFAWCAWCVQRRAPWLFWELPRPE